MSSGGFRKRRHVRGFAAQAVKDAPVTLVENNAADRNSVETILSVKSSAVSDAPDDGIASATASTVSISSPPVEVDPQARASIVEAATLAEKPEPETEIPTQNNNISEVPALTGERALLQQLGDVDRRFDRDCKDMIGWLWSLRAPLFLLTALALVPKLIALWIFVVLAKPIASWLYPRCPQRWKDKMLALTPNAIRNSDFLQHFDEGADQALPFILFWLYLCCAPFALIWMMVHWIKGLRRPQVVSMRNGEDADSCFVFPQNKRVDSAQSDNNFYHSRAFGIVLVTFFALGIPAFFSLALYEKLGVDKSVNRSPVVAILNCHPSDLERVAVPQVGIANRQTRQRSTGKVITVNPYSYNRKEAETCVWGYNGYLPWLRNLGVEPKKATVFFVHFYLVSLASALTVLFFRAWFTFPLNFLCDEHDVEVTTSGIKRRTLRGWFLSVITINRWSTGDGPDWLKWTEVKSLRHLEEGFTRLCPLPETAFKKESLSYKLLNKGAALIDGLSNQANKANFLVFSTSEQNHDFGRNIKINLNDLNREQRARLFYAVKQWAPHVKIMKNAEEKLIGSTVLQDVRYTQLWFDLLTSKTRTERHSLLKPGDTLKSGEFTIEERLSAGGQATTYLARRASGGQCVLKEFILATSSCSGALIESAREFEAEVSLLSQLKHPGIVRLEDYFCEDGRVYVVLEYVQGQSLRQLVSQAGPLSQVEVVRIGQAICEVLEYLHSCNPPIVHRDITPENILVQPDGAIKLIDFSLAVKQDGRQTTDSCAKQAFTPPEQFREEVCVQSDIYALGATIYYLLLGSNPKPISRSSPQSKAPDVVPRLNAIVEHATELDLSRRYESVQWLKLDLDQTSAELKTANSNCQELQPQCHFDRSERSERSGEISPTTAEPSAGHG